MRREYSGGKRRTSPPTPKKFEKISGSGKAGAILLSDFPQEQYADDEQESLAVSADREENPFSAVHAYDGGETPRRSTPIEEQPLLPLLPGGQRL